jgi:hypothetical protein
MLLRGGQDFETADPPTRRSRYNNYLREGRRKKPITRYSDTHAANAWEITASFMIPSTPWQAFLAIMQFRKFNRR